LTARRKRGKITSIVGLASFAGGQAMNIPRFYITSDNSENRFDSAEDLQGAIRIARKVAKNGQPGDAVCIEHMGKNIRQFVLMPNGNIAEEALV
jgi:hypothetical protein